MSDIEVAQARVIIRPDTTRFRAELEQQLAAVTRRPVTVPVALQVATSGAAAGIAAALATSTATLAAAQQGATRSAAGLAAEETVLNSRWAEQAVLLPRVTAATLAQAGAHEVLDRANRSTVSSTSRLNAGLLGLRTAVGSSAVIGLGALSLAAIVAGEAFRRLVTSTAQFERELSTFNVVTGATAQQMEAVSNAALELGADVRLPAVSAGDAATAMTELARAGLTVQDSLAGAEGVLQLAAAAQIENAEAAQIAANALNSFGLAGDQATRVADTFANAANAAQGSIADIGLAFRQASAVARQVGLTLEDTTAILSLFAKNGLTGSDAGTALRTSLIRLIAPTKKAAAEIDRLGIRIRDAQGNLRADVFAQFGEATASLEPAARDAAAALIFGQDAIRAVAIGAREGVDGLRLMQFQIDQTGTASEVASARTEGLGGAFSSLSSNLDTLGTNFGRLIAGPMTAYLNVVGDAIAVTNLFVRELGNLATAALDAETPIGRVRDRLFDYVSVTNPVIGGLRAIRFGIDRLGIGADENEEKLRDLQEQLQALQTARVEAERGGQTGVADRLTREINALRQEINALKEQGEGIDTGVTAPLQRAIEELEKARDIRIDLNIDTAPLDRLIARLREQIPITQRVEGNINRLRDDIVGLGEDSDRSAGGVNALARALSQLGVQSAKAQAELLRLQTEGGTPQQQIAVLQQDIATQREIIRFNKANPRPGSATAITNARNAILADQAEIEALRREIESSANKAEQAAEDAADLAEKARDKQDAALIRLFAAVARPFQRRLDRAALTERLTDDIKLTQDLIRLYTEQIQQAQKRIRDVETRNRVVAQLSDQLFQLTLEFQRLQQQQRERLLDALRERQERIVRGIELDIELADINENVNRGVQLRLKLIAALKKQARVLKLQGNALKENRNEQARIRKEIEELRGETRKTNQAQAQAEFEFLQAQQGFAANLFGNLIPGFATGGLVGGGDPGTATIPPDLTERLRVEAGLAQGTARTAPTAGGQNATNQLLSAILQQLKLANQGQQAPEATRQRRVGSAAGDGAGAGSLDNAAM